MIDFRLQRYAAFALAAAALFGASAPAAKPLAAAMHPALLAGLLYLGCFAGLACARIGRHAATTAGAEAALARRDLPALAGSILAGGVLAPPLFVWGLAGLAASGASLLLSAEAIFTVFVAAALFREPVAARIWIASALVLAGSALLAWAPDAEIAFSPRAAAVLGACLLWGLDNNFTRNVSAADPYAIAMWKGLVAGSVNTALGLSLAPAPSPALWLPALGIGALGYGASLVLYVLALRHLGAARTAAHFGTAPFIGAALAVLLLDDPLTVQFLGAFALTAAGTAVALSERHEHEHAHAALEHSHRHVHDAHHRHDHAGDEGPEPHTHRHRHEPMRHRHSHFPDLHHRHRH